jgi:hypothetical protein
MPSSLSILDHFSAPTAPRRRWRVVYPLPEILLLIPCATLCGMDDFVEIRLWGEQRLDFLRRFLTYARGLPAHDTLDDVVDALDADLFKAGFTAWAAVSASYSARRGSPTQEQRDHRHPLPSGAARTPGRPRHPRRDGHPDRHRRDHRGPGRRLSAGAQGQPPLPPDDDARFFADPGASIADIHESLGNDARRLERRRASVCHEVAWMVSDRRHPGEPHRPPLPPAPRAPSRPKSGPPKSGLPDLDRRLRISGGPEIRRERVLDGARTARRSARWHRAGCCPPPGPWAGPASS